MTECSPFLRLHTTARFQVMGLSSHRTFEAVEPKNKRSVSISAPAAPETPISIFLDVNDNYTRARIQRALSDPCRAAHFRVTLGPGHGDDEVPMPPDCSFQWAEYERIHWTAVLIGKHGASSYCVRKGLSRKAQLAHYTRLYVCKNPTSILKDTLPQTVVLDTWPVWGDDCGGGGSSGLADIVIGSAASNTCGVNRRERLDKCLEEARTMMHRTEATYEANAASNTLNASAPPTWILKPSTINKGERIQIVHCYEQVVDICWSESDIREWVLQQYISPPLLLQRRKFHIRAYVVAVSAIRVYLSHDCLALSSGTRYSEHDTANTFAHITNTAYQDLDPNFNERDCVRLWNETDIAPILVRDKTCTTLTEACERVQHVNRQMERVTAEVFRAYRNEFGVFAPIEGCFEHFGLDFVVDEQWRVFLLELNPGPDFKQTGDRLSPVIENLMGDTADVTLLNKHRSDGSCGRLVLVYESQARSNLAGSGINMKLT